MSEDEETPAIYRFKRPLLMAVCGIGMTAAGVAVGMYLTSSSPDAHQGFHSTAQQFPPQGIHPDDFHREQSVAETRSTDPVELAEPDGPTTPAERIANYVRNGDLELQVGNYAEANSFYRHVLNDVSGDGEASVRYRLALSAECSGAALDALEQYQHIVQKFSASRWSSVAQLGRVRCLAGAGQSELLDDTIYRTLILDPDTLTPAVHEELLHVAARSLTERLLNEQHTGLLNDKALVLPHWNIDPHEELAELNRLLQAGTKASHPPVVEVLQKIDSNPDSIYLRVHTPRLALRTLQTDCVTRAGLSLQYTEQAEQSVENRRQVIHAEDMSLAMLLDGLTVPFSLLWQLDGQTVQIRTHGETDPDTLTQFHMKRTERILALARVEAPTSRQVAHTRMAHGCLLFQSGRPADAVHVFSSQVESSQGGIVGTEAAFNLGKCYLVLRQPDEAEKAFYHSVDAAGQQRATGAAGFLYLGRIQLEDARFQLAASSLRRALHQATGTSLEEYAAAALGCAYLLDGKPQSANQVMFDHRDSMKTEEVRNAVAFVAALARFRSAVLREKREVEARDVVTTLSNFKPQAAFGAHWEYLAAQACEEIGLTGPALHHYVSVTRRISDGQLKGFCLLRVAERYRRDQRLSDASELLSLIDPEQAGRLSHEVILQTANVALQQNLSEQVIQQCRHIATDADDQVLRRRALHLMGRAFEQRNDHKSAVYCFAGMLPRQAQTIGGTLPEDTPGPNTADRLTPQGGLQ